MATPNIPLLKATMDYIEAHPEEWNQEQWRCGSGLCFAGWAATLNGREWAHKNADGDGASNIVVKPGEFEYATEDEIYDPETGRWVKTDRQVIHVSDVAAHDLGLDETQADILFDGYNTRTGLRMMVDALKEGREIDYGMQVSDPEPEEKR